MKKLSSSVKQFSYLQKQDQQASNSVTLADQLLVRELCNPETVIPVSWASHLEQGYGNHLLHEIKSWSTNIQHHQLPPVNNSCCSYMLARWLAAATRLPIGWSTACDTESAMAAVQKPGRPLTNFQPRQKRVAVSRFDDSTEWGWFKAWQG